MSCTEARLDEFLDGELDERGRAAVDAHLAGCPSCRQELEGARKLEALLLRAGTGGQAAPDADRFVDAVRARSRRRPVLPWFAAAALLLAAFAGPLLFLKTRTGDPAALVAEYAKAPSADLERRIAEVGLDAVEPQLAHPDVRVQFAAATLLFRLGDAATRERIFHRLQAPATADEWYLSGVGIEVEDEKLVPIAVSALEEGSTEAWPMDVLRRLHHLNRRARESITGSVVTLLKSDRPRVQRLALDLVKELEVEFPLAAVVELIDSPELGEAALRVLRQATGKDAGRNRDAWMKLVAPKEENP
jgi:hypothetical protein